MPSAKAPVSEGIANVCKLLAGNDERSGRSAGIAIPAPLSGHDGSPWEEGGNIGEAPEVGGGGSDCEAQFNAVARYALQIARFLKVCRYDQLRRNSCYDELGCNSLVVIALLLRPA